ncbi:MAG: hypothetical protein AAF616_08605 [Bacteroidota bacterium]
MDLIEAIGWLGAALLLLAFVLNLFKKIQAEDNLYLLLNLAGSLLLLYNAYQNNALPFVVVNLVWVIFSAVRLVKK